jgi:hypothetical protein
MVALAAHDRVMPCTNGRHDRLNNFLARSLLPLTAYLLLMPKSAQPAQLDPPSPVPVTWEV